MKRENIVIGMKVQEAGEIRKESNSTLKRTRKNTTKKDLKRITRKKN